MKVNNLFITFFILVNLSVQASPLHDAAQNGNLAEVQRLIAEGHDLESKDNNGRTPLHWAALYGHTEVVRLLISSGANLDTQNNYDSTPLQSAVFNGHTEIARLLIAAGANLDSQNNYGSTPLHLATSYGHTEAVRLLIAVGANLDSQNNYGWIPLHRAAFNEHTEVAILLIASRASLNIQNHDGNTPLHLARGEIFEILSSDNPYNHPRIIKAKKDHEIFLGRESLRKILGHNVELEKLLMYREAGIKPKSAKLIEYGKKRIRNSKRALKETLEQRQPKRARKIVKN